MERIGWMIVPKNEQPEDEFRLYWVVVANKKQIKLNRKDKLIKVEIREIE